MGEFVRPMSHKQRERRRTLDAQVHEAFHNPGIPTDAVERKACPVYSGVLRYFPDALAEVARVSKIGNDQHNPGQPLHWAKEKSRDEADALVRHLLEAGTRDTDGQRHSAKVAWRALALLQREIDAERGYDESYWEAVAKAGAELDGTAEARALNRALAELGREVEDES